MMFPFASESTRFSPRGGVGDIPVLDSVKYVNLARAHRALVSRGHAGRMAMAPGYGAVLRMAAGGA